MMKVCLLRNRSVLKRGSCGAGRNVVNTYRIVRPTWFVNEAPKASELLKSHICHANENEASSSTSEPEKQEAEATNDDEDSLIERQLAKRRPKPKASSPPPGSYKVISATRDQVYGSNAQTSVQKFENGVVSFLSFLFIFILAEGVFLAASGFLPDVADQFAQNVVYPSFSPTIIFFLVCSSLYGLWKTGGGRKDEDKK